MDKALEGTDLFSHGVVRKAQHPITDYSGYYKSTPVFEEVSPTSCQEAAQIIQAAYAQRVQVRSRGNGHSLNGSSLPKKRELLLKSEGLNHFQFLDDNQILIGAGVTLWDLEDMLRLRGYQFPMANGGFVAPTVAGFISAGGLGNFTEIFGGFWNAVLEITLITGEGETLKINRDNPLFPWVFGSMGQLGFITEVKMKILAASPSKSYNLFSEGIIPRSIPPNEKYCWFTLFASLKNEAAAQEQLLAFAERWQNVWLPKENYRYLIAYRDFNPPLLFPDQETFIGIGIWGRPKEDKDSFDLHLLKKMDADFHEVVLSEKGFRRYIQTEFVPRDLNYRRYFGREIYNHFFKLKRELDPHMLFNRGTVFADLLTRAPNR